MGQPMPAFQMDRDSKIVPAFNDAYKSVRGDEQPTGVLPPTCFYGSNAGHLYNLLRCDACS
jgi:acetylornithine deacetylase